MSKYGTLGPYHRHRVGRDPELDARYTVAMRRLLRDLGSVASRRILDVGCGDGVMTERLHRAGARVIGLDADLLALRHVPVETITVGDGGRLPFRSLYFDAAVAIEVLEHVEQPGRMLAEIARVLVPGGLLVLTTPRYTGRLHSAEHVQEFTADELRALLRRHFHDLRIAGFGGLWGRRLAVRVYPLANPAAWETAPERGTTLVASAFSE